MRGKVLRYRPDGTIPADNPFGPTSPVWVGGLRNPFGLAFGHGQAFVTSNGPTGDAGSPGTGYDLALIVTAGTHRPVALLLRLQPSDRALHRLPGPPGAGLEQRDHHGGAHRGHLGGRPGAAGLAGHFVFCSDVGGMRIFEPGSSTPHATVEHRAGGCDCST